MPLKIYSYLFVCMCMCVYMCVMCVHGTCMKTRGHLAGLGTLDSTLEIKVKSLGLPSSFAHLTSPTHSRSSMKYNYLTYRITKYLCFIPKAQKGLH